MKRDFTFIDDLIAGIVLLSKSIPSIDPTMTMSKADSLSKVAPYRLVNIGNSSPVSLKNFIASIEKATGVKAKKKMMPMQPGDVTATWADGTLLNDLTGFTPNTDLDLGIKSFVDWYRLYYNL
jgi:UDP-glucuronate 4-epimerase